MRDSSMMGELAAKVTFRCCSMRCSANGRLLGFGLCFPWMGHWALAAVGFVLAPASGEV
jgi:hypothetical protein